MVGRGLGKGVGKSKDCQKEGGGGVSRRISPCQSESEGGEGEEVAEAAAAGYALLYSLRLLPFGD